MPFADAQAATTIRALRKQRGLSPEALAAEIRAMARQHGWKHGAVDAYTIRRIEGIPHRGRPGLVPGPRVAFVIAHYFGLRPDQIWKDNRRVKVSAQ